MIRLRMAAVAASVSLAFVAVAAPVAGAANGTGSKTRSYANLPALYTVQVTGKSTKGGKTFTGTFGIQRFVKSNNKAYALGTLKGKLGSHHITRYGVKMPASLNGGSTTSTSSSARAAANCQILNLVLGPINLNLLGLVVNLGGNGGTTPITLNITAVSGPGNLLGNLLCDVSNLLNPNGGGILSSLQSDVTQLVGVLNGLLGDLSLAGL